MSRQGWEDAEFPIVCESCLGSNPYIRMLRQGFGKECKICGRPYTVFKWSPGEGMRWKRTEVCQTCAKIKNVCQCCLLDLDYALPTKIRDAVLESHGGMPSTDVNTQVFVRKMEEQMGDQKVVNYGKAESAAKEVLRKLARGSAEPYSTAQRGRQNGASSSSSGDGSSRAPICVFFLRGLCKRGDECQMRHDRPANWDERQKKMQQGTATAAQGGAALVAAKTMIAGPAWSGSHLPPRPAHPQRDLSSSASSGKAGASVEAGSESGHHDRPPPSSGHGGRPRRYAAPFDDSVLQSHAEVHRRKEREAETASSSTSSATNATGSTSATAGKATASKVFVPMPPPPPGQGPATMYPSQDPSILGTSTRSFRA